MKIESESMREKSEAEQTIFNKKKCTSNDLLSSTFYLSLSHSFPFFLRQFVAMLL